MSRRRWIPLATAGLLAATAIAARVLVPRIVRVDAFRPELEERLSTALGRPVTLAPLRLTLGIGVALRSDALRIGDPASGAAETSPTLEARHVRVRVAVLPLLRRRLLARSFAFDDGTVRVGSATLAANVRLDGRFKVTPDGEPRSSGTIAGRLAFLAGRPEASVGFEAALREGRLVVESAAGSLGPATFAVQGEIGGLRTGSPRSRFGGTAGIGDSTCAGTLDAELRDGAPYGRFGLDCPSIDVERIVLLTRGAARVRGLVLRNLVARGTLEAGELRCPEATFELYSGRHRGGFVVRPFEETFPFELDVHLAALSIEDLAAAVSAGREANLRGTGDLDLSIRGTAPAGRPDETSLEGAARILVRDGAIASVGVLRQIGALLESAGANGIGPVDTPFRALSANFRIERGAGRTDDLAVRSDDLDLDGRGTVGPGGVLDFDLVVSFSTEASAGLVERNSKLRFRVGPDGRLSMPLRMAGTLAAPELRLDVDRVLSEGVERILRDKSKRDLLRKWLGGR